MSQSQDDYLAIHRRAQGLPRVLIQLLGLMACLAVLYLLHEVGGIIAPLFLTLNLVITAYPIHTWLVNKGTPSWLAAIVMALSVLTAVMLAVLGLVWSISVMVNEIPQYSDKYWQLYHDAMIWLEQNGIDNAALADLGKRIDPNAVVNAISSLWSTTQGLLGVITIIVASLVFMVMDTPSFAHRIQIASRTHPHITLAMRSFGQGVRRYWLVTTIFGLIVAFLDWVALVMLGVPLAAVWGLLSFLTNYIPNIGFVIGLLPVAIVALLAVDWQTAVAVIVIYSVLNFVIQSLIQPRFTGESVGVTPTMSFISLLVWGWTFGAVGTLVALPMTLLVKALLIDADPKARWFNSLIASDPRSAEEPIAD